MFEQARVAAIRIYPVKSLDAQQVNSAALTRTGALEHDRRWAFSDPRGNLACGKRMPAIHRVRSAVDLDTLTLTLGGAGPPAAFSLVDQRDGAADWMSHVMGEPLMLVEDADGGFPDDVDSPGPTFIGEATLDEIASWFPGESGRSMLARLRPNVVIAGIPAFAEDHLFGPPGERARFLVGGVEFLGNNPCQRCVVPSRDPITGVAIGGFQKRFAEMREAATPDCAGRGRFNHYYRAAVNTLARGQAGRRIAVGDPIRLP